MTNRITIIVRHEVVDKRGHRHGPPWEQSYVTFNELPPHIVLTDLLAQAHTRIHPPKPVRADPHKD